MMRTPQEIDAAAKAIAGDNWDGARWREQAWYRERARAALEAADAVGGGVTVSRADLLEALEIVGFYAEERGIRVEDHDAFSRLRAQAEA
jgi:hypothetical protein